MDSAHLSSGADQNARLSAEGQSSAHSAVATPLLSILVVAYNSAALIADCIASVPSACRRHRFEILLVDNGDGSTEVLVAEQFPEVRIIPSRGNIGFAAGNNLLAQHAKGDHLLLLNPDMVLHEGAIDALFKGAAAYPDAGAWGGVTVDRNGQPDTGNAIPVPSLAEFASAALGRSLQENLPTERLAQDATVPVLMGGFVMFPRSVWDAVDGLDERYFLYCEEVDLFRRLSQRGYAFWRIAAARGFHHAGHGDGSSPMRVLYHAAGTMQFVRIHWSPIAAGLAFLLVWIGAMERFLAGRILGRFIPRLQSRERAYRLVALRPGLWMRGYDKRSGLLVKLEKQRKPRC